MVSRAGEMFRRDARDETFGAEMPVDSMSVKVEGCCVERLGSSYLAPLAGRGRSSSKARNPGEGGHGIRYASGFAERAPHPNPPRASFARLDPAKSGAAGRLQAEPQHSRHP